jgi:hypothetical protein
MSSIKRGLPLLVLAISVGNLTSCEPAPLKKSLEVESVNYDTSGTPHCTGQVRNLSSQIITDLQVQVEFQNEDRNRVRTATASVLPKTLAPSAIGSFSVPYQRGSTDPPVVGCRVVEFKSANDGLLSHSDKTGSPGT